MTFNRKTGLLDAAGHEVATGLWSAEGDKPASLPGCGPSRQRRNRSRPDRRLQPGGPAAPAQEMATVIRGAAVFTGDEVFEEVCDVDLDALDVELPRGFGRD